MTFQTWGQTALLSTTVSASPSPTDTSFGVATVGDLRIEHIIWVTISGTPERTAITGIAGSTLTVSPALSSAPIAGDDVVCYADDITNDKLEASSIWASTTLADLKATDTTGMPDGTRVHLRGVGVYYLSTGSSATGDDYFVIDPTTGPGRWLFDFGGSLIQEITSSVGATCGGKYIANSGSLITVTLPATAPVGAEIEVFGKGSGGWKIGQNSGQSIHFGVFTTTTGMGGSLSSFGQYDAVRLVCIVANTTWVALSGSALQGV